MSEEEVVRYCSPTLANLKTGSLFSCRYPSRVDLTLDIREINRILVPKGLRVLPLRYEKGRALIYVYRPGRLKADLVDPLAEHLLSTRGYPCGDSDRCVTRLMQRLQEESEFPHEIGLFLGYPPDDVLGFIQNNAAQCKCVGDWKVYGDESRARRLFAQYKKCTAVYSDQLAKGKTIAQLTVCARS